MHYISNFAHLPLLQNGDCYSKDEKLCIIIETVSKGWRFMKVTKGIFIGITFGMVLSLVISFGFMLFAQGLAGGTTSLFGESWLYFATIVPFALTFSMLGIYFVRRENPTNKNLWLISFISAFLVTLYSGTIGALFGEYIVRGGLRTYIEGGYIGVNVEGVVVWGTIYAFIFLPFSTPLARWFIHIFQMLLKRVNLSY